MELEGGKEEGWMVWYGMCFGRRETSIIRSCPGPRIVEFYNAVLGCGGFLVVVVSGLGLGRERS